MTAVSVFLPSKWLKLPVDKRGSRFSMLSLVLATLLGYVMGAGAQSPPVQPPQLTLTTQATQST